MERKSFSIIFDREDDGRWIAEIPKLPGVLAYGATKSEAARKAQGIALHTIADAVEHGRRLSVPVNQLFTYGAMARS
jgi:predicted RNase H-like HicB family nuclease